MKLSVRRLDVGQKVDTIRIDHDGNFTHMTPDEAVELGTRLINLAYPLTRPKAQTQQGFRSSFNQGCHRPGGHR